MLYLPASVPLRDDRVGRPRIAVLRYTRRTYVHEQFAVPHAHVRKMQVSESDRGRGFFPNETSQHVVGGVRPEMLVVGFGVRVNDQQLVVVFADTECKRQAAEPRPPAVS